MAKKIAHQIVIDVQREEVRIDGIAFPYYLLANPEVMTIGDETLGAVRLDILASNLEVIGSDGSHRSVIKASLDAELEWARRRATEIVIESLAPILKRLGKDA